MQRMKKLREVVTGRSTIVWPNGTTGVLEEVDIFFAPPELNQPVWGGEPVVYPTTRLVGVGEVSVEGDKTLLVIESRERLPFREIKPQE